MSEQSPKYRTADKPAAPYSFDVSRQLALRDRPLVSPDEWYQALVINAPACHHPSRQAPQEALKPTNELPVTTPSDKCRRC